MIIMALFLFACLASRRRKLIPDKLQNAAEIIVSGVDDFVCGILGERGRRFVPFLGTLFIYILFMNLAVLIPFFKSSTSSWSTTLALSLCVFAYVQYTAIREHGFLGYLDHLMGRPRGILAFTAIFPVLMFFLHTISELVKPISLSLRLRSNMWGEDLLVGVLANLGVRFFPLAVFSMLLAILASIIQALVFCLLSTIYFALVLTHEDEAPKLKAPCLKC
ncbi:MAG: F0F1 ATP synthase subunit A [Candidatus Omnitrophica bacterium]|nr:F0F1 ATP synthase subunit A [Candidatus Omnitrophota bacterium]MBU1870073.1 F0F1 ATP synthase subunit A [Candidatus Omnitrophota bacterium]